MPNRSGHRLNSAPDTALLVAVIGLPSLCWLLAVLLPLAVATGELGRHGAETASALAESRSWNWNLVPQLIFNSAAWGAGIAATSTLLAIPAALVLARRSHRRLTTVLLTGLLIALLCFPSYMTYWVWGLALQPVTSLGDWVMQSPERAVLLSGIRVWWGLSLWCWPLAALAMTPALRAVPIELNEMAVLDGASVIRRSLMRLRAARAGLALAFGITFVSTLTSYVVFDLAQTNTSINNMYVYGNALRRLHANTFNHRAVVLAALPMMLVASAAAAWVIRALRTPPSSDCQTSGRERVGIAQACTWVMVVTSIIGPFALIGLYGRLEVLETLPTIKATDGRVLTQGAVLAIGSGLLIAMLGLCLAALWATRRRWLIWIASIQAAGWVWVGLMPAAATGAMLVLAYNRRFLVVDIGSRPPFNPIYDTPVIVMMAHLARYAMLAALFGRWIAKSEPQEIADLRLLDAGESIRGWLQVSGPRIWLPIASLAVIGSALALSEVSVSVIVYPPGWQSLAERLLNHMHYGREDYVITVCLLMMAIALVAGLLAVVGFQWLRVRPGRVGTTLALIAAIAWPLIFVSGCGNGDNGTPGPLNTVLEFGSPGRSPGQFVYPRAIDLDAGLGRLYIIDKTGRIQWFTVEGQVQTEWDLPEYDQGYPTGISVNPATHEVYVADTHEHRITVFDQNGTVIRTFGSYGTEPGQMIFPTDIAFGPDGTLYVSEYGGNDRVQVFSPDGSEVLFQIGEPGREEGRFSRPQNLVFDAARQELWIADACNHRLVVTDPKGQWLFTIGQAGTEPGDLSYPYTILLQDDGTVLVTEYGNNRIQHLDRDGRSLGVYGATGQERRYLKTPWSMAATQDTLFILDSGNNRVQAIRRPG
ncbi:MAG: hypothetical protein D8M59_07215 [Planctomycetes bacterium]|nr:hypothetical protein [Planctomycetota bacterium]NOG53830.1 hypothetical protein [Planctomycetota bacterium]